MSQTLNGNPKEQVKLSNPNTIAKVKLCLFCTLYILAQEIVCSKSEVFNTISSG